MAFVGIKYLSHIVGMTSTNLPDMCIQTECENAGRVCKHEGQVGTMAVHNHSDNKKRV